MVMDNENTVYNDMENDVDEMAVALQEAQDSADTYTHVFKKPFVYMNKKYDELHFDWGSLYGNDSLAIEAELQALGVSVIVPTFSGPYLIRLAARACTERIGSDALGFMNIKDYNRIRSEARSFLLASE